MWRDLWGEGKGRGGKMAAEQETRENIKTVRRSPKKLFVAANINNKNKNIEAMMKLVHSTDA